MYWFLHVHYYYMVTCVRLSFSTHVKLRRLYCSILLVLDWHLLRLGILLCCVCRKRKSRRWRQCLLAISAIERQTPWYDTCYRLVDGFVSDPHFTLPYASLLVHFSSISSIVLRGKDSERPAWKDESWALLKTDCNRIVRLRLMAMVKNSNRPENQ